MKHVLAFTLPLRWFCCYCIMCFTSVYFFISTFSFRSLCFFRRVSVSVLFLFLFSRSFSAVVLRSAAHFPSLPRHGHEPLFASTPPFVHLLLTCSLYSPLFYSTCFHCLLFAYQSHSYFAWLHLFNMFALLAPLFTPPLVHLFPLFALCLPVTVIILCLAPLVPTVCSTFLPRGRPGLPRDENTLKHKLRANPNTDSTQQNTRQKW